jgi:hypothetical protein
VFQQAGPHHPGFLALKRDSSHGTLTLDLASGGIFALAAVWRSGLRRTDCCANGCAQLVSCEIGQPALGREAQKHDGGERVERSVMTRTNRCRPLTRPIDKSAGLDAGRGWLRKGRGSEKITRR